MDSRILSAIFQDPVLKQLTAGKSTGQGRSKMPESLVAKVTALKGDAAVLRWEGGNFTAHLNARVVPGETLLLNYNGTKEGRPHYRIMARLPGSATTESNAFINRADFSEPLLFGLFPGAANRYRSSPALVRFIPPRNKRERSHAQPDPLMELFLDTENFGLVLVYFYSYAGKRLEFRFVVESQKAGKALEKEARRLVKEAGGEDNNTAVPLQWSVGNLRKKAVEILHQGGFGLNARA